MRSMIEIRVRPRTIDHAGTAAGQQRQFFIIAVIHVRQQCGMIQQAQFTLNLGYTLAAAPNRPAWKPGAKPPKR